MAPPVLLKNDMDFGSTGAWILDTVLTAATWMPSAVVVDSFW
jgi:hypothetical protein